MKTTTKHLLLPVIFASSMAFPVILRAQESPPPPPSSHGSGSNRAPGGGGGAPLETTFGVCLAMAAGLAGWKRYKATGSRRT